MNSNFEKGYHEFSKNSTTQISTSNATQYISGIDNEIEKLTAVLNSTFKGNAQDSSILKGDVAEFWHSGTFNINAILNGSTYNTNVDRSHIYASADITSNFDKKFGLKYYFSAQESAKQQAKSYFERYNEFTKGGSQISFQDYLLKRGILESDVMHDPIYSGQVRIIPKDQLETAIEFLKIKIAKEEMTRPDQVKRYQETLNLLQDKILAPDGTESIPLSNQDAIKLATLSKEGNFNPLDHNLSVEELVQFSHILKEGLKAGTTAATITLVLTLMPEIYKVINQLIEKGDVDEEVFREIGFKALSSSSEAFLRGTVAASLTSACKSGMLGAAFKNISPNIIAVVTVMCFSTIKDSFNLQKGELSQEEFINNIARNMFISGCSLGFGFALQSIIPLPILGYMLGNFIGSMVGAFAYGTAGAYAMALSVNHGLTFFGIVDQNYTLPDNILKEIGLEIFEYEKFEYEKFEYEELNFDQFTYDNFQFEPSLNLSFLSRGVIGFRQVGYV